MTLQAVTCDGKALIAALGDAMRAVETNSTIPTLQNVRLSARNGRLGIAGTNLDIALEVYVEASGEISPVLVNGAKLSAGLKGRENQVSMQIDQDGRLKVSCGRSRLHYVCLEATDFPWLEAPDGEQAELEGAVIKAGLAFCAHAVSRTGARPALGGIYFDGEAGCMVATDGQRLARRQVPALEGLPSVIVPDKTGKILAGLVEGEVRLWGNERLMAFEGKNWRLVSKLIDAEFPDYPRVIPAFEEAEAWAFDRDEMLTELATVRAMAPDKTFSVLLSAEDRVLKISSRSDGNDAHGEVDVEGPDREVKMSAAYLADALRQCGANVRFGGEDAASPQRIELEDGIGTLVIMPLRI